MKKLMSLVLIFALGLITMIIPIHVGAATTAEVIYYGTSVRGQDLRMYKINPTTSYNKEKVAMLVFAVHGFEDAWANDGKTLESVAYDIRNYYESNNGSLMGWTLYIVPVANPDGLIYGTNNSRSGSSAYGRCTSKNYDMNRSFGTISTSSTCKEAYALRTQIEKIKPSIFIDFHGWYNGSYGSSTLAQYFKDSFNAAKPSGGYYGIYDCNGYVGETNKIGTPVLSNGDGQFHNLGNYNTDGSNVFNWVHKLNIGTTSPKYPETCLIEFPAPTFDGNSTLDTYVFTDPYGNKKTYCNSKAQTFLTERTKVALNKLFNDRR